MPHKKCSLMKLPLLLTAALIMPLAIMIAGPVQAAGLPQLDKTYYHSWEEVNDYLDAVAQTPSLKPIVKLITIGHTREGRALRVLRISREDIFGKLPDTKPAAFICGAHHAREHISKEAVLGLIDLIIHKYGQPDPEGKAITYLVDEGTFYLLPWVNPDGGTSAFNHNPEQRKTNYEVDEPQIGAASCDTCGDGLTDEDSPDLTTSDVGELSATQRTLLFANNGIIGRHLQLWYENNDYTTPVLDMRVARIQPGYSAYTFNYEGTDPDGDGLFGPYSGEDFYGGTDPNRNYGDPLWGDCAGDEGCSFLSGAQTYAGPAPFSEPETAAIGAFLRSHPNIGSLETLHSGINEIYPPWFILPDDPVANTMDLAYTDSVAQYISQETGYDVVYGGPYATKGDTTGYSYTGSSQDPALGLDFYAGGLLSFTTEIYGMGSESGSAEAIKDWFPNHYQQFDTNYPQGIFIAWTDFPWCTTCDPAQMPGPGNIFDYLQYTEYFIFNSENQCDGASDGDIFHCDYWGIGGSVDYYADFDIFAYFNPPGANRAYKDWNSDGSALVRTVDRQLKHLLYRLYVSPFIKFNTDSAVVDKSTLSLSVENIGFLRSSIMTASRNGEDPFTNRYYDHGNVDVDILFPFGFSINGASSANIGWLGGGRGDDPEPRIKTATFPVKGLSVGDFFIASAQSDKTGRVLAIVQVVPVFKKRCSANVRCPYDLGLQVLWTNAVEPCADVAQYFTGSGSGATVRAAAMARDGSQIQAAMARARKLREDYRQIEGPFELVPGKSKGIVVKKYH